MFTWFQVWFDRFRFSLIISGSAHIYLCGLFNKSTKPNGEFNGQLLVPFRIKNETVRAGLSKGLRGAIAQGHHMIGGTTWADCRINIFRINIIFLCGTYIYSPIILIHLTNTNFYGFLAYLHAGGKGGLFPPRLFPTVLLGQRFGSVLVEYFCPPHI